MGISCGICILAAGAGTRLKLSTAKAIAPICGKRLVDFPIMAAEEFGRAERVDCSISVVTGHLRETVEDYLNLNVAKYKSPIRFAVQKQQLGTADAVKSYFNGISDAEKFDYTMIMCADTPLLSAEDLTMLFKVLEDDPKLDAVAATFETDNPHGYGRIVKSNPGFHIVEEKDADSLIKKIKEVNSGMYVFKTDFILKYIHGIGTDNRSGEFYLTDLFTDDRNVKTCLFPNAQAFLGINTLEQLEVADKILRKRKVSMLRNEGVRFMDSNTSFIDWDVTIGEGSLIYPNVYIESGSSLGKNSLVEAGTVIKNSKLDDRVSVFANSYLEDAIVESDVKVGPFARLRPGANIGKKSKIGNFVEIKKATLEEGVKVSHLSYVGDAHIGQETNIGCGFITCNYDGIRKHQTVIGKRVFMGSDCQTVAPVKIGDDVLVAAGTTITTDVEDGALAISRKRQENKPGLAKKLRK